MALQIQVDKTSVTDAGEQFQGKVLIVATRLRCWAEGVDTEVVDPVIDKPFSETYKDVVESTIDEQIARWEVAVKKEMQLVIDKYKREITLFNHAKLDTAITNIQGGLQG